MNLILFQLWITEVDEFSYNMEKIIIAKNNPSQTSSSKTWRRKDMSGMKIFEEIICDDRLFSWQEIQFNQISKSFRFLAITNHLILS